jgi:hypothetical protein
MKQKIYDYLKGELYSLPHCDSCQYFDIKYTRKPCNKCDRGDKYKFHKGHDADLKRMAREIYRIVRKTAHG